MKSPKSRTVSEPIQLSWSHYGTAYRVTCWPDVSFERQSGDHWIAAAPSEAIIDSAVMLGLLAWRRYLEFVPAKEREFLEQFKFGRLAALQIIARCPAILDDLNESPALTSFLAAHASLRGSAGPRWAEIAAIHEHGGIFGVLDWLGLPASRQTLRILQNVIDPDVPRCLLEPLRTLLWEPKASFILQHTPSLTDHQLTRFCHALAA